MFEGGGQGMGLHFAEGGGGFVAGKERTVLWGAYKGRRRSGKLLFWGLYLI